MSTQSYYLTEFENTANIQNIEIPLSVNCTGIVDEESFSTSSERRDFYLMYVISGDISSFAGVLKEGDMLIIPPSNAYSYESEKATYLWVHFTGFDAHTIVVNNALSENKIMHIGVHETLKNLFENLFFEFMLNDSQSEEMTVCILKEILILSGRYQKEEKYTAPLKSISYINKNYTKNISIEELANIEKMSLTAFRMLFRKHTGTSPLQYIASRKLSAACRLLEEGGKNVSSVAASLGFQDPYYFSRFFKKHIGISPKQYQKKKS